MANIIKAGDVISVHYTGKFENQEVFDSSEGQAPLTFTVGTGQLITGFDKAVIGMQVGEKKSVTIQPVDGYGEKRADCIINIPRENIPAEMKLEIGTMIKLVDQEENPVPAVVTEINDDFIQVDVNHFLAGKTLIFDIEIMKAGLKQ